jgi:coenzyme F420-0:L-glutamate ligase/coenzyme F420-1:gamma-L-glutamate ligase
LKRASFDVESPEIRLLGLKLRGDVKRGDDLGMSIFEAQQGAGIPFDDGDIYVVAQKVVSKAEGRSVRLSAVKPSPFAESLAAHLKKDPREVEVVLRESRSIIKARLGILITETKGGIVCANSGADRSNVADGDDMLLLPMNPDGSARSIRRRLESLTGKSLAVIVSDTFGRPWREGQVDFAIGVSGIACFRDYRGKPDMYGRILKVTNIAQVDELAAAAELVMGKTRSTPVVLVKGLRHEKGEGSKRLLRRITHDLFR